MSPPSIAETSLGPIEGLAGDGVTAFLGVPYGAAGPGRRFRPPEPAPRWTDTRKAQSYGATAPQPPRAMPPGVLSTFADSMRGAAPIGEDCLHLNIWTPAADDRRRPVMVWLHPGGFSAGANSAPVSEGTRLARRGDVVVVSVAQRLNVFGYLYLAELGGEAYADSGNAGQLDLVLALAWIRDNIARFGGDPGNVTLFGESGGGCKICTLMAMPAAKGLFHKGIVQSGPMMQAVPPARGTAAARFILDALGLGPTEAEALQHVPMDALVTAYAQSLDAGLFRTFSPVLDGRTLTRDPFLPDAPPEADSVALMIGYTVTETTFLLAAEPHFNLDWETLPKFLAPHLEGAEPGPIIAGARALRPQASASDLFFDLTTQMMLGRNSALIATLKARQSAPVYAYLFAWTSPVDGGRWGSPHTIEIPLVFDNVDRARAVLGDGPEPQRLADRMSEAWIAFARHGDPNPPGAPAWPRFDKDGRTLLFDISERVQDGFTAPMCEPLASAPLWHCAR